MEKDKEIWVGKNKLFLDEDNIIHDIAVDGSDKDIALAIQAGMLELAKQVEGKVNLFIDLNKTGKPTPEARKIYKETAEMENIGKVAMFGVHPVARILAAFIIGVSGKKDIKFFSSKEMALVWLKNSK